MEVKPVYRMGDLVSILGLSRFFIASMRKRGKFPEPIDTGSRTLIWRKADIDKFLHLPSKESE